MSARRVHLVGAGRRVREAFLPVLARLGEGLELAGPYARSARPLEAAGAEHAVRPLAELTSLGDGDLLVVAVSKDAVPAVLAHLVALDPARVDLLIDTPVVRFRHFGHAARLRRFRAAWVAEDCATLPWLDTVRAVVAAGHLGRVHTALLEHCAYAYHGLAVAKALLGAERVRSGRRRRLGPAAALRELAFAGGTRARVLEPRDYAVGRFLLLGTAGSLGDHPLAAPGHLHLEPRLEGGRLAGFRAGDVTTELDDDEAALAAGDPPEASVTARTQAMKRVGLLRLLRAVLDGRGGYPVADALDDTVVDYHLERLGRYVANPFTSPRSPLARALLGTLGRRA